MYLTRLACLLTSLTLLRDELPPLGGGAYPAVFWHRLSASASRGCVCSFVPILLLPLYIGVAARDLSLDGVLVIAWSAILVTGSYPEGLRRLMIGLNRWYLRVMAYYLLLRDEFPGFTLGLDEPPVPLQAAAGRAGGCGSAHSRRQPPSAYAPQSAPYSWTGEVWRQTRLPKLTARRSPTGLRQPARCARRSHLMPVDQRVLDQIALSRDEYDEVVRRLGREPNEVELGMFGALWSEHCGYKNSRPLLGLFPTEAPQVMTQAGEENAGAVAIGDGILVAMKVESHNHPSAIEPFQGAATGVGGIIRDIFAMGARPIALLDSLRFGPLAARRRGGRRRGGRATGACSKASSAASAGTATASACRPSAARPRLRPATTGNPLVNAMCVGIAREGELVQGARRRRRQSAHPRRRGHRARRHPRRDVCQRRARRALRGAPSGRAGRQPLHGKAAARSLHRAGAARTGSSGCRTSAPPA